MHVARVTNTAMPVEMEVPGPRGELGAYGHGHDDDDDNDNDDDDDDDDDNDNDNDNDNDYHGR